MYLTAIDGVSLILALGCVASAACSAFAAWQCAKMMRDIKTLGDIYEDEDVDEAIDVRCNCCNFLGCLEWHEDPDDTLCPNCGLLALEEIEVVRD